MKKNKKIIIICTIILLIALAILLTIKLVNINNKEKQNTQATVNNNNGLDNNLINNEIENNNQTIENSINPNTTIENTVQNTIKSTPSVDDKQEVDIETIKKEENNEQKALNIAKEDWGEDNTVYFTFDTIDDNGRYLVCVRNSATTEALYWYTIDLETGTFTIE